MSDTGTTMNTTIDSAVFSRVPDYHRIVVTATVSDPQTGAAAVADDLARTVETVRHDYGTFPVLDIPEIASWRRAFKNVDVNPSKFRPAVEALLRRAVRGDDLQLGHPLIDLGTAVSLATLHPVGMHTVDDLTGPLSLHLADGTEVFTNFAGETKCPDVGEVVYCADTVVLTRRWVWRQGAIGSIDPERACRLAVNIDSLDATHSDVALRRLTDLLAASGATNLNQVTLSATTPSAVLSW